MKSPPQYLVPVTLPSFDVTLPQGQSTSANSPMFVSGHIICMVRFGFPEWEGMLVLSERHPSIKSKGMTSLYLELFSYQIDQLH